MMLCFKVIYLKCYKGLNRNLSKYGWCYQIRLWTGPLILALAAFDVLRISAIKRALKIVSNSIKPMHIKFKLS